MSDELKYSIEEHEHFKIINIDGVLSVSNAEVFEKIGFYTNICPAPFSNQCVGQK